MFLGPDVRTDLCSLRYVPRFLAEKYLFVSCNDGCIFSLI
jgi:hypothetical protein